jgi:hypothetical protein
MGKLYPGIEGPIRAFIEGQQVFFVATAPLAAAGHVNLSPKGLDTLRVLGPRQVAYLDYVGSGAETLAHLRENGRIVLMFCAFEGPPKIVRLHGRALALEPQDAGFAELRPLFPPVPIARAIIRVEVERIADSCGYGVPLYRHQGPRSQLPDWAARKGEEGLLDYQREHNAASIDGLPALRWTEAPPTSEPSPARRSP